MTIYAQRSHQMITRSDIIQLDSVLMLEATAAESAI